MRAVEFIVFKGRLLILALLAAFTVVMGYYALQLKMEAGFLKQVPKTHEYVQTFLKYQDEVPGANLILVAVKTREGDIWNPTFLKRLSEVAEEVTFLPGVRRTTVQSLWSTTTRVTENTEEGINSYPVVPSSVTANSLTQADADVIRDRALNGGHKGYLVSNDQTAALIIAELQEFDPVTRNKLDYLDLAARMEKQVREKYEDDNTQIEIVALPNSSVILPMAQARFSSSSFSPSY